MRVGHGTNIARHVAKWGMAQMCLWETKYQGSGGGGGVSHHFGRVLTSLTKYHAIWGIDISRPDTGVIAKEVFSLQESLESLNSLASLENRRILLCLSQSEV